MRIYIDVSGTLIGNPYVPAAEALQLVQDASEAGHDVRLVSADPDHARSLIPGIEALDKQDVVLAAREYGVDRCLWVDDDEHVLACVARMGAHTLHAGHLRGLLASAGKVA